MQHVSKSRPSRAKTLALRVLLSSVVAGALAGATGASADASQVSAGAPARPTVVLVHGAFADSSSWNGVARGLRRDGYPVLAVANPLRDLTSDTAYVRSVVASIDGPVVLVGHSYAGMIISQVAAQAQNVKALVYAAAFIPQAGESTNSLNTMFPGSGLAPPNLITRPAPSGTDVYIKQDKFGAVYAGGLSKPEIEDAAIAQRPITAEALAGVATVAAPAATPKWEIVALDDHAVPTKVQQFMAKRAGARVVSVHSGHDVPAAAPAVVEKVIVTAAKATGR